MKHLHLITILAIAVFISSCHPDHNNNVQTNTTKQLVSMYTKTADSSSILHFYYDSSNYVIKVTETDTVSGSVTMDSITYQYKSTDHTLTQAIGVVGTPLISHVVKYVYHSDDSELAEAYYNMNDLTTAIEYVGITYINNNMYNDGENKAQSLSTSFPSFTGTWNYYGFNTIGNMITDSMTDNTTGVFLITTKSFIAYDNEHNYTALLKGVVNPSIHNIIFPFYSANNCTAQTITDYTGTTPVTTNINTVYKYNGDGYPTIGTSTNAGTGATVTTLFTYQ